ncbi:glutamate-5-semialdehyde dehydrogenase [Corynebacterium sp. sy039]|uniref:glutamate-5-semialdehyde dehydrogenase n=1 Tax=Corynebacterium sp. sy039 TaxID=2599641 RepID=UPI0011B66F7B|nr:glutamate-5-semialdehyde dehydrogenase [Corynebacterium sp. sy039]QDZ43066.1 glutamate-5-semialdehyde dehydrogenase [Corynebacterium sp. sy039]
MHTETGTSTDAIAIRAQERESILTMARAAKAVTTPLAKLNTEQKNAALYAVAQRLEQASAEIIAANEHDISAAKDNGLSDSLIDRLRLDQSRISAMAQGLREVAALTDPVGEVVAGQVMPNGITMRKVRVPLGVMGMVYEARPNVTVDAFGLALKSGNAVLLRGSKSARHSNEKLVALVQQVLVEQHIPRESVQLLPCQTRESVRDLIQARGLVDVIIPRGGAGLIESVVTNATVATIETGTGNCHFYIDRDVLDLNQAIAMLINGKTRRPSVCNATETVLIDQALPTEDQYKIIHALQQAGVQVHGDIEQLAPCGASGIIAATEQDWAEEYLSFDIAAKLVDGVAGAIAHIRRYSSGHTEAIATGNIRTATQFTEEVDAAAVMVNASTAFTDGQQYGMGAEIGISTQKLHARGPMALPELTTTKWILHGDGQTRP